MVQAVKKHLKTIFKVIAFVAGGILLVALLIGFFYGDDIKKMIIAELNKQLVSEVSVENFEFSVIRHFPNASVDLQHVLAKGLIKNKSNDTLLYADRISLQFNLTGIFSRDVSVRKIVAKNGTANIYLDSEGKDNYHIWKTDTANAKSSSVIDLRQILLENMQIRYEDNKNDQHYLMKAIDAEVKGVFSADQFTVQTSADLFVEHLFAGRTNYITDKNISLNAGIHVNTVDGTYKFDKSKVKLAGLGFDLGGYIVSLPGSTILNLRIDTYEADLEAFISMLPPAYISYFDDYRSKGKFICSISIEGKTGSSFIPAVKVNFSVRDGKITPKESTVSISEANLNGTYTNRGRSGKSELSIPDLSAKFGSSLLKADIRLEDLQDPFLTMHASSSLDLVTVRHFISIDTLVSLNGNVKFDIAFAGKIRDVKQYGKGMPYKVQSSGNVELNNISFVLKHNPLEYRNINGVLKLMDNDLKVEVLSGNISSTDLKVNGLFKNFINFIFIPDQFAEFNATLSSKLLDLDELLEDKSATSAEDTSYIMKFNPRLYSHLNVQVANLKFRKFRASRLQGKILLDRQVISGRDLTFSSMHGMIFMNAIINASRKDSILMNCDAKISGLDITGLFTELENFGQTTMTDQNVRGKIDAGIQFSSSWTTGLVINPAKVKAVADISIENGELNQFVPIQALARYIKVSDLNNIKFSALKNQISIADRKITIPSMEIKSSALNLTASGVHDFDNVVDYRLRLLLSDVLGKKVKQNQSEFGEIEDDGLGRTQLLLTMKGPIDNPRFGYDRKGAEEKLKTDLTREKQTMKSILREEFGFFKKDTIKPEKKAKKEEMQIEWEEEKQ